MICGPCNDQSIMSLLLKTEKDMKFYSISSFEYWLPTLMGQELIGKNKGILFGQSGIVLKIFLTCRIKLEASFKILKRKVNLFFNAYK